VAVDLVRSGEVMLALVAGRAEGASELLAQTIAEEPMVVVTAQPARPRRDAPLELMTIEPRSATWASLESRLRGAAGELEVQIGARLQSFTALVQMARAGFGNALVPLGVATALKVPKGHLYTFPGDGLTRPISLVGRLKTFDGALVSEVSAALERHVEGLIPAAPREEL
jgi:DNA-binding transcriptional LysR family regulator